MNMATVPNIVNILILILCIFGSHVNNVDGLEGPIKGLNKYKEIVKTYQNEYGDILDCVNVYHQPAFEHPLLKNHLIQKRSLKRIHKSAQCRSKHVEVQSVRNASQYCPKGTIPIIRSYRQDVEVELNNKFDKPSIEYAHVGTKRGSHRVYGAKATLQHATPIVATKHEYSVAHILLVSDYTTKQQKSIEAGWARSYLSRLEDVPTRFFIRWTNDGYRTTGCSNLDCSGFIQTNNEIVLGGALGNHNPIKIEIYHDTNEQKWYLLKNCEEVGYWPDSIFTDLENGFQQAFFGGEILDKQVFGRHTLTQMGNGRYGTEGEGRAAAIHHIQVRTDLNDLNFHDLDEHELSLYHPQCYNASVLNPHPVLGGFSLYYGGPGYNIDTCKLRVRLFVPPPPEDSD